MSVAEPESVPALVRALCDAAGLLVPAIEAGAAAPDSPYFLDTPGVEQVLFSCALMAHEEGRVSCLAYDHAGIPDTAHHALARVQALGPAGGIAARLCAAIGATSPILLEQDLVLAMCRMDGKVRWTLEDDQGPVLNRPRADGMADGVDRLVRALAGVPPGARTFSVPSYQGLPQWGVRAASPEDALRVAMAYDLCQSPFVVPTLRRAVTERHVVEGASAQSLSAYRQRLKGLVLPFVERA